MALNDGEGNGFYMPVAPAYTNGGGNGGFGWGNDWAWIIILLLAFNGGWGNNGFGGGFGGNALGYDFPWLMNGQQNINSNTNSGFRDAMINDGITSIRDGISGLSTQLCGCCGDIQNALCSGFAGTTAAVTGAQNALAQQMYSNQIADLERSFAAQTASTAGMNSIGMALQNCCCENRAATADLKYTVASENCADRAALAESSRDIIDSQTRGTQAILDKLCALELDAKNDTISQLRQELLYARGQASQDVQTAAIRTGQATTANQLVQELRSCPVPSMPVYGMTPIFTCGGSGCGCGCGA